MAAGVGGDGHSAGCCQRGAGVVLCDVTCHRAKVRGASRGVPRGLLRVVVRTCSSVAAGWRQQLRHRTTAPVSGSCSFCAARGSVGSCSSQRVLRGPAMLRQLLAPLCALLVVTGRLGPAPLLGKTVAVTYRAA